MKKLSKIQRYHFDRMTRNDLQAALAHAEKELGGLSMLAAAGGEAAKQKADEMAARVAYIQGCLRYTHAVIDFVDSTGQAFYIACRVVKRSRSKKEPKVELAFEARTSICRVQDVAAVYEIATAEATYGYKHSPDLGGKEELRVFTAFCTFNGEDSDEEIDVYAGHPKFARLRAERMLKTDYVEGGKIKKLVERFGLYF